MIRRLAAVLGLALLGLAALPAAAFPIVLRGGLTAEEYRWKLIRKWGEE